LDGGGLIAAVFFGCFGALLEASKVHLVQLDSKLVDLELVNLVVREGDFQLNWDDFAEGLSLWSSEGQVDGVDLVVVRLNMGEDSQGDGHLHGGLALDFLFNWDVDDLDGVLVEGLLLSEGEGASLLPWPVGVVQDLDLFDERGSWAGREDGVGLLDDLGSLGFP